MKSNTTSASRQAEHDVVSAEERVQRVLRSVLETLGPGDRLPSVRQLVLEHRVSPVTVQRALAQLTREGKVVTRPGDGTFVATRERRGKNLDVSWQSAALAAPFASARELDAFFRIPSEGTLILGSGYPDASLQPLELLAKAAQRASRRTRTWSRLSVDGLSELRQWFANDVGGDAHVDQVLLVPGGQAALSTLFRALVPFGGPLIMESPTYFGAIGIARAFGLRLVPVPHDEHGIRPDLLRAALASTGARVVYLQPWFSNPTGISLSPERRREVLHLVQSANAFLIEDDYARDLVIEGAPPAPLYREGEGHVIYVRSLTKSTAPGVRVGAILASGPVLGRLKTARAVDDWFLSGLLQETALELVTSRSFAGHVRKLRAALRERRDTALQALVRHLPEARLTRVPAAGFSLWLELPPHTDEARLVEQVAQSSVHVNAGSPWFPAEPTGPHLRISLAGAPSDVLSEGIRRLGQSLRAMSR